MTYPPSIGLGEAAGGSFIIIVFHIGLRVPQHSIIYYADVEPFVCDVRACSAWLPWPFGPFRSCARAVEFSSPWCLIFSPHARMRTFIMNREQFVVDVESMISQRQDGWTWATAYKSKQLKIKTLVRTFEYPAIHVTQQHFILLH